jgi:hypothetical protein
MASQTNTYSLYCRAVVANWAEPREMTFKRLYKANNMKIDFDLNSVNIEKSDPVTGEELIKFREQIMIDLPPSFLNFKKNIADSFYISTGNALSIFPLCNNKDSFTNVVKISRDYAHLGDVLDSHKLLIFGMSGVDSETWAFYTDKKYLNGEYPILWISPGEERFFFHSTSFESFINIQYKSLTDTDSNTDYNDFYKTLVKKYDNQIEPFGYDSVYSDTHDLTDLEEIMNKI